MQLRRGRLFHEGWSGEDGTGSETDNKQREKRRDLEIEREGLDAYQVKEVIRTGARLRSLIRPVFSFGVGVTRYRARLGGGGLIRV